MKTEQALAIAKVLRLTDELNGAIKEAHDAGLVVKVTIDPNHCNIHVEIKKEEDL